jgi:hypothetical protein
MLKRVWGSFSAILICVSLIHAYGMYVIDTPTKNILDYTTYGTNIKFFSQGSIISEFNFGIFKFLNIGMSWEVDSIVGNENPTFGIPSPVIKIVIYEGNQNGFPGVALGYAFQGFIIQGYSAYNNIFVQQGRGGYLVFGSEIFIEGLSYNIGANINDFSTGKVFFFSSLEKAIYDGAIFKVEFDNVNTEYFSDARVNVGFEVFLTEHLGITLVVRDLFGKAYLGRVPNERMIQIGYSGKF